MSLILMESGDLPSVEGAKWDSLSGTAFNVVQDGRTCWGVSDLSGPRKNLGTQESSTVILGFRFYTSSFLQNHQYFEFLGGGGTVSHLSIRGDSSGGGFDVQRGGVSLGTTGAVAQTLNWHYLEIKVTISDSVGSVDMVLDGTSVLSLSGVDTRNGGTDAFVDQVFLSAPNPSGSGQRIWYRDIVIMNDSGSTLNDFIGPVVVEAVLPDGAGNYTQFTPNTGLNYQAVDDPSTNDGDTTYVESTAVSDRDSYSFTNLSAITNDPLAVQAHSVARYSGAPLDLATFLRRSATDNDGTATTISGTYATRSLTIWETDPIAAGAWTLANFNSTEFGIVTS